MTIEQHRPTDVALTEQPVVHAAPILGDRGVSLVEWANEARAANALASSLSRTPFAGSWRGDADGATAAILKGAELGLTPVTALGAFDNIQGRPAPSALTLRALAQAHGHEIELVEESAERAVARYRRKGAADWSTTDFTLDDARAMGLLSRDQWKKQPRAMLVARVTSKAARLVAADVLLGIGYSAEELRDDLRPAEAAPRGIDALLARATDPSPAPAAPTAVEPATPPADSFPADEGDRAASAGEAPSLNPQSALARRMFAVLGEAGITDRAERLREVSAIIGREVTSSAQMSEADAHSVIAALEVVEGERVEP